LGLTVTTTNIERYKRGVFERGIFVGEMLRLEKQSEEGELGIYNVYEQTTQGRINLFRSHWIPFQIGLDDPIIPLRLC